MQLLTRTRRTFYNLDGPWYRNRLFEAVGSDRYAHPALFGLDRFLAELMPWRGGRFLEAGAHDGYTQSNTYFLERHLGWQGILVEPVPELRKKCEQRRPGSQTFGCALVGPDHAGSEVEIHFGDLMSSLSDRDHAARGSNNVGRSGYTIEVPALTLDAVLEQAGGDRLDLMVLDLEGHELDALAGLDLERHGPRYLMVESLDKAQLRPELESLLHAHYAAVEAPSAYDLVYARRQQ